MVLLSPTMLLSMALLVLQWLHSSWEAQVQLCFVPVGCQRPGALEVVQSHVQVPHGRQGKMRGGSPVCPARSVGLGKDKTYYWFCLDVLACVCPAMCYPWPEPLLLSIPTPLMVCAGVVHLLGWRAGTGCASALVCRGHC